MQTLEHYLELEKQLKLKRHERQQRKEEFERTIIEPLNEAINDLGNQLAPYWASTLGLNIGDHYRCRFDYNGVHEDEVFSIERVGQEEWITLAKDGGRIGVKGLGDLHRHWEKVE
jgi:hypothetical protein